MCIACCAERQRINSHRKRQVPKRKRCRRCQQTLTADHFHHTPASADGLRGIGKECQSASGRQFKQESSAHQPETSLTLPSG